MPKKTPAPLWAMAGVKRADAGGTLYNAIHLPTGHEYWGVPSYDGDAIMRRVTMLNASRVPLGRAKSANSVRALESIFELYDGQEVDSDTHSRVMEILTEAGYLIREPDEPTGMEEG